MIQRSLYQTYRTAALVGAAVVFSTAASQLHAQALNNLSGGTSGTTTLTDAPATVVIGTKNAVNGSPGSKTANR